MNKKTAVAILGVVGLSLLLAGCAGLFQSPAPEAVAIAPGDPAAVAALDPKILGQEMIGFDDYVEDRIIVGVKRDGNEQTTLSLLRGLVGEIEDTEPIGDVLLVQINLKNSLDVPEALGLVMLLATGRLDLVVPPPPASKGTPGTWTKPTVRGQPVQGILFAEPDYIIPPPEPIPERGVGVASLEPTVYDPNADLRPYQWALDAINAGAAWAQGYTGQGIIVAVMDTGVDGTHPDLQGQLVDGIEVSGMTPLLATANSDTHNHGTHCAGIIAAKNDGKGVVGLAYNVKIMPIRIFVGANWISNLGYARGVKWAVDNGAKVLSNSWGGAAYSQVIKAAVDYALANNVVHVNSAGNDIYPIWRRPASIPGVIGVAATDPRNKKAGFSTPGTWVSVGAPGVRVLSSVRAQTTQAGTGLPLRYDYYDGTSMACPYVSALAAMILEKHPTATPYQVKKLLEGTAKDIEASGFDTGTGYGLIQADRALAAALPANNGAALRVNVVTASSMPLWEQWWPVTYMDLTLRRAGRIIAVGQTDFEGKANIGFPTGDYPPGDGLAYFPILEPGTYEVVVGGDDTVLFNYRTANRVTGRTTVTLTPSGVHTVDVQVNTTLQVTLSWTGGDALTDIDLAVFEPGVGWTYAWNPGLWGSWTDDESGPSGTETYTLYPPGSGPYGGHYDDAFYPLAVRFWGGAPATVTVTVRQNTVTETYTFTLTTTGVYPAYQASPLLRWPGWWNNYSGPYVF